MERNIPPLLLILVLPAPLCAATPGLNITKVVHVSHLKTWWEAQYYCRSYHSDLVTIRNKQEANMLALFEGWIGLRWWLRSQWTWSRGNEIADFIIWDFDGADNDGWCALKYRSHQTWASDSCAQLHPFLCMDERLILVREMKTWEEALLHCRQLQVVDPKASTTTHLYDLASLPEANNILLDREMIEKTDTNEVWVGLRFLAGKWFWVSGEVVTSFYLRHCPAQQQHCGALRHKNRHWKMMNCSEKRNFLCSVKL